MRALNISDLTSPFVKSMPPSLSELKVIVLSFCFAFKIPDDVTATSMYVNVLLVPSVDIEVSLVLKPNSSIQFVNKKFFVGITDLGL